MTNVLKHGKIEHLGKVGEAPADLTKAPPVDLVEEVLKSQAAEQAQAKHQAMMQQQAFERMITESLEQPSVFVNNFSIVPMDQNLVRVMLSEQVVPTVAPVTRGVFTIALPVVTGLGNALIQVGQQITQLAEQMARAQAEQVAKEREEKAANDTAVH